jgi:hypothetical protein
MLAIVGKTFEGVLDRRCRQVGEASHSVAATSSLAALAAAIVGPQL